MSGFITMQLINHKADQKHVFTKSFGVSQVPELLDFELGYQELNTCEFKAVCLLSMTFPLLHGYKHL